MNTTCAHPECEKERAQAGFRPDGKPIYRKKCDKHYREELASKKGFNSIKEYYNSIHPIRKHKKDYCENIDGRLGFVCTSVILIKSVQLHVDHIDGDPSNENVTNYQTLCASCHAYKGAINEDHKSPGRVTLGLK